MTKITAVEAFNKTVTPEFKAWFDAHKKQSGLTFEEIARRSNFTRGHIHNALRGEKTVTANLCVGLANAFCVPPSEALVAAGIEVSCLPVEPIAN